MGHRALTQRFNILENIPVFIISIYKHIIYIREYLKEFEISFPTCNLYYAS